MLKAITTALFTLLFLPALLAQQYKPEFGIISPEEAALTVYEKDPAAEAVVLFDIGESVFFDTDQGYDIRFTKTKRIKILSRAGIDFAEITIPFYVDGYGKTEKIVSLKGYSYIKEDGNYIRKPLDTDQVYEEKINDRWHVKKFVFPAVKEGSIIEYQYVLETPFHFNLPDWQFQDRIPTVYSQYTACMIPFYEYVFLAQGVSKFDFQESKLSNVKRSWGSVNKSYGQNIGNGLEFNDLIYTYIMKDVPAFRDEAYITSADDYLIKIDFQLAKFNHPRGGSSEVMTTWPEMTKTLLKNEHFGKYTRSAEKLAKKILESDLQLDQKSEVEKSRQIIEYVKTNFSWNKHYGKYTSKNPKEFVNQKSGGAAEINLFLNAMLNEAGITAYPVILSTRDHGKIKTDYPFDHFFNYVIVLVEMGDQAFLADATEALLAFNKIPPRCINEKGLVVKEKDAIWVDLYSNMLSVESKSISLSLDPVNLTSRATVTAQSTEFYALHNRNLFHDDTVLIKESLLKQGFEKILKLKTLHYAQPLQPYTVAYEGITELEKIDNKLIISPFLNFPPKENKLTQKKRTYPVDLIYAKKESLQAYINIPEGYKVLSMPKDFTVDDELATLSIKYVVKDNLIEAQASYHFKKSLYISTEYPRIKYYFDMIVQKFNEQIILEAI